MATNLSSQITAPAVPNMGTPAEAYDQRFFNQTLGNLGNYFRRITSIIGTLFGPRGGKWINNPYGSFQDFTDQTVAANTAAAMRFDTTDISNGVSVVSNSRLTVTQAGIYNLQFSSQFQNTDTQLQDVSIWIRQDAAGAGSDVPGSMGLVSVPNSHGGIDGHTIVSWNYLVKLNANDFVELWWSTTSALVSMQAYAAGTSPTRPSAASVIATMTFVSNLSTENA